MRASTFLFLPWRVLLGVCGCAAVPLAAREVPATLDLDDRVACQWSIEEVLWRHRLWPRENGGDKPPLGATVAPEVVRDKAEDGLRQSRALEELWGETIDGAALQTELDRMAAQTRQPEVLRELFAALGDDPHRVAECLVRPLLAGQRLGERDAWQEARHQAQRRRIEEELATDAAPGRLDLGSGDYRESRWRRGTGTDAPARRDEAPFDEAGWSAALERLRRLFGVEAETFLPLGRISALQEDRHGFYAVTILELTADRVRLGTASWPKEPFAAWWAEVREDFPATLDAEDYAFRLPALGEGPPPSDAWRPTPSLPDSSTGTAVWTGSEMIFWGGFGPWGGKSQTGSRYNPATDTWSTTSTLDAPQERSEHSAVWTGSEMIVWGGCKPNPFVFCELSTGGRYDPVADRWVPTGSPGAPAARMRHTAVWTGSRMIVWGGCVPITEANCSELQTGGRYDPATDSWQPTTIANAASARSEHTAVWTGSERIVWGGAEGPTTSGGRYEPATDTWEATTLAGAPTGRRYHSAVWTGAEMIVWGGCEAAACPIQGAPTDTGGRYDPLADRWSATAPVSAPSLRARHSAVWSGEEMIVWGGEAENSVLLATGARYAPLSDTWVATSEAGAPVARSRHRAVWIGEEMVLWGGGFGAGERSGGRYDPGLDTWSPTNASDPDSWRYDHEAVWTGAEMIAWGGEDTPWGTFFGSGVVYTPATASWRDTSLVGAPSGRYFHSALWTGSRMVVWGGQAGTSTFDDGARYDVVADTWSPTSMVGAPETRGRHTAVWTGDRMIVWGGVGEFTPQLDTGARYDPVADAWQPTSTVDAPTARGSHSAIWTGSEMIVWGGYDGAAYVASGGRYDPAADAWLATSEVGAPEPRGLQAAVWTGTAMVVWGGFEFFGPTYFDTGGRYDPGADAWSPTSLVSAPTARANHSAVWSGEELIVWGGCGGSFCTEAVPTGGRYDPQADAWVPTTTASAPSARSNHTAVWTESEMIVWGGITDAGGATGSGGHYGAVAAAIFADGFESGDTGAWSVTVP